MNLKNNKAIMNHIKEKNDKNEKVRSKYLRMHENLPKHL